MVLLFFTKNRKIVFTRGASRLALVIFSITSALWALTSFIATLINTGSVGSCQVTIIFATLFDQVARVSLMQALVWEINNTTKPSSVEGLVFQGILLVRFITGSVFVGFQRPQTDIVCITRTSLLSLGVLTFVMDTLLITGLLARVVLARPDNDARRTVLKTAWKRTTFLVTTGLGIWTMVSSNSNYTTMEDSANESPIVQCPDDLG